MSNILSEVHPELVAEWSDKNLPLTPDRITFYSITLSSEKNENRRTSIYSSAAFSFSIF